MTDLHRSVQCTLVALCSACVIAGTPTQSTWSAEFTEVRNRHCRMLLSGPIEIGDAARFEKAYQSVVEAGATAESSITGSDELATQGVCLDSDGGSYTEGIAFAKLFRDAGIPTVVDENARCLSACAIAFMGGTLHDEPGNSVDRKLHVLGKLGFHAPYIDLQNVEANQTQVDLFYQTAIRAVGELLEIAESIRFDVGLIAEMLRHGRDRIYLVGTIEDVGRWNIDILGFEKRFQIRKDDLSKEMYETACESAYLWHNQLKHRDEAGCPECTMYGGPPSLEVRQSGAETIEVEATNSERWLGVCKLALRAGEDGTIKSVVVSPEFLAGFRRLTSATDAGQDGVVGSYVLLPRPTKISTLASPSRVASHTRRGLEEYVNYAFDRSRSEHPDDIDTLKNTSLENCKSSCLEKMECRAFTYDKWNRWCFLKQQIGQLRFDPAYSSAMIVGAGEPRRSSDAVVVERYRGKAFPPSQTVSQVATGPDECEEKCVKSSGCVAFSFYERSRQCQLHSEAGEYYPAQDVVSGVKRQK